jgi:hypothetical protein
VHVIAGASPDNTPAGYYLTFLFPMLLFIVIALILWALFGRPHHRVPAGRIPLGLSARAAAAAPTALAATAAGPGVVAGGGAPAAASAEPEPPSAADEADGGQLAADGAGAGE